MNLFYILWIFVMVLLALKAMHENGMSSVLYWLGFVAVGLVGTGTVVAFS